MAVKKGSKNNLAFRGMKAQIKFYNGKQVKESKIIDRKKGVTLIGAQFDNGDLAIAPDGSYVAYSSIRENEVKN